MIIVAVPVYVVPMVPSYRMLLYVAFFLGMAGSSFAVGIGFLSRWFPPERQGGALGIYGLGNIGQSVAAFPAELWCDWADKGRNRRGQS
jgi:nitrate/nitrite transporter NarK